MLKTIRAAALLALLAACAETPGPLPGPIGLDYSRLGQIVIAAGNVETVNQAVAGDAHFRDFKPTLAEAVQRWNADRVRAGGGSARAVMVVREASLTREKLPHRQRGMDGWFTREQGEKWGAKITAEIQVTGGPNGWNGRANATVSRFTTVPEDAKPAEKENAYRRLLIGIMDDFDKEMARSMREHLNPVLMTVPGAM